MAVQLTICFDFVKHLDRYCVSIGWPFDWQQYRIHLSDITGDVTVPILRTRTSQRRQMFNTRSCKSRGSTQLDPYLRESRPENLADGGYQISEETRLGVEFFRSLCILR